MFNKVMLTTFLFFLVSAHSTAPCKDATCQEDSDSSALLQGRIKAEKAIDTETAPKMAHETGKHSRSKLMSDDTLDELEKVLKQAADLDNDTDANKTLHDMEEDEKNGTDPGEEVVGHGKDHGAAMNALDEVSQEVSPEDELNETGSVPTAHMLQELNNQSQEVETKDAHAQGMVQGDEACDGESEAALLLQMQAQGKRFVSNLWEDKMNIKYCFASDCANSSKHAVKLAVQHYLNHIPCLGFKEVSVGDDAKKKCSEEPAIYIQSKNDGCWANVGQPRLRDGEVDPNCKDSTDYKDPGFGDKCDGWKGFKCTGYSYTAELEKACPVACKKCPMTKEYSSSAMNLEPEGCDSLGTAAHELGHNLGMLHEQSRADSYKYVKIHWDNIKKAEHSQYEIDTTGKDVDTTVDYDAMSLMHYGDDYFGVGGGKKTMTFVGDSNVVMGNRMGLTYQDVLQTARMYGCEDEIKHFKLCTEKADGCTKEACSCGPSTKLTKIQDGDCFRCMEKCPPFPRGTAGSCGCPAGFTKSCFEGSSGENFCGCSNDACKDSDTYKDPEYGDTCAEWVGYGCSGYSFSDGLMENCPKACKKCYR